MRIKVERETTRYYKGEENKKKAYKLKVEFLFSLTALSNFAANCIDILGHKSS